jgi:CMP-N,N'-diacetyllegionaminic acid synthase
MEYPDSEGIQSSMSAHPTNRIAFVPARGGSRQIPRKNLVMLCGKPLIDFTIDAARNSGLFDQIVVSTDSTEIADRARHFGCQVHQRPDRLATDSSRVVDAVLHAADTFSYFDSAMITVLQPTSPLRQTTDIQSAIALSESGGGASVVSVTKCEHHPLKTVQIMRGRVLASWGNDVMETSRQELPEFFRINGALYVNSMNVIRRFKSLVPVGSVPLEMTRESSLDIDEDLDLLFAETILMNRTIKHAP